LVSLFWWWLNPVFDLFSIVLYNPEIPPNTGNIIRLCANTGSTLNLIEPLGFSLEEKQIRRAGLDYHDLAKVKIWSNWTDFVAQHHGRLISFSTKNSLHYSKFKYRQGDALLFGSETSGLPKEIFDSIAVEHRLHIPMLPDNRSLNLSNCVAVAVYEGWRQLDFTGTSEPVAK